MSEENIAYHKCNDECSKKIKLYIRKGLEFCHHGRYTFDCKSCGKILKEEISNAKNDQAN